MARFQLDGQRYTLYGEDIEKLQNQVEDMKYEIRHGIYAKEENITVDSWYNTWLEEYKRPTVKVGTIVVYEKAYKLYIKPEIGKRKLKDIQPQHIQKLYNDLARKDYSANTILSVSEVLNGMYKQAVDNGIVQNNPAAKAKKPKCKSKEEKVLPTKEQQKAFLKALSGNRYETLIKMALFTGMRTGEMRGLQWKDIDFKNKEIHVRHTLKYIAKEGFALDAPKTKTSIRTIPMLDSVETLLREHRRQQLEMKMKLGKHYCTVSGFEDLVFLTERGKPLQNGAVDKELKRICQELNEEDQEFPSISPHSLRHLFATRGLEQGIPLKVMQTILGHSTLNMTANLYSHVLPDTKAEEMRKLEGLM